MKTYHASVLLIGLAIFSGMFGERDAHADFSITGRGVHETVEQACSSAGEDAEAKADAFCRSRDPQSELSRFALSGRHETLNPDSRSYTCIYSAQFTCR